MGELIDWLAKDLGSLKTTVNNKREICIGWGVWVPYGKMEESFEVCISVNTENFRKEIKNK